MIIDLDNFHSSKLILQENFFDDVQTLNIRY
jgi:hypothetical protein